MVQLPAAAACIPAPLLQAVSRRWHFCCIWILTATNVLLQVAAYRFLARYTPDKDLRKPVDR